LKGQPTAEDLKRPEVISVVDAAVCRAASGELSGCRGMRSAPKKIFATIRVAKPPLSSRLSRLARPSLLGIFCSVFHAKSSSSGGILDRHLPGRTSRQDLGHQHAALAQTGRCHNEDLFLFLVFV
jgi:hypothetical protein